MKVRPDDRGPQEKRRRGGFRPERRPSCACTNGLADLGGITYVTVKHENNAALAAEAYGRLTGRPGVALTTAGPGALTLDGAGQLEVMSYTTRLTPGTSSTMRLTILASTSYGRPAQSAVAVSREVPIRSATISRAQG